jgi:hypothetical protein
MDNVEFYEPPRLLHQMREGTWVAFHSPKDPEDRKRRGYVRQLRDTRALVLDEHSWDEVRGNLYCKQS